ncbi:hypothetical protein BJY52DRAFT_1170065 [Lactarius psammicola]|nr:hypothetical protein BJY52DRAFT_1170065 [Lactarius psammicola]
MSAEYSNELLKPSNDLASINGQPRKRLTSRRACGADGQSPVATEFGSRLISGVRTSRDRAHSRCFLTPTQSLTKQFVCIFESTRSDKISCTAGMSQTSQRGTSIWNYLSAGVALYPYRDWTLPLFFGLESRHTCVLWPHSVRERILSLRHYHRRQINHRPTAMQGTTASDSFRSSLGTGGRRVEVELFHLPLHWLELVRHTSDVILPGLWPGTNLEGVCRLIGESIGAHTLSRSPRTLTPTTTVSSKVPSTHSWGFPFK